MKPKGEEILVDARPDGLAERLLATDRRVLLLGQPGIGKTTLAQGVAAHLFRAGRVVWCVGADPGSPAFGAPGAVCLGRWEGSHWSLAGMAALCTLDAGRFRLPVADAVRALAAAVHEGTLLVDAPGAVRGVVGAELLSALVTAAAVDLVLVMHRRGQAPPLVSELAALGVVTAWVHAADQAQRPGKTARARRRTALWHGYLAGGREHWVRFAEVRAVGTPPPPAAAGGWIGRQVAFLDGAQTLALGEVTGQGEDRLLIRLPTGAEPSGVLLVRDACRSKDGLLGKAASFADGAVGFAPPPDVLPPAGRAACQGPRPVVLAGSLAASLVNGVFGDPLLHLRLGHQRRSLLFDLGEGSRLPARIAHQVSDVLVTHAHIDHIAGFLWLLRSRIGGLSVCRMFGPPRLAEQIAGLIRGICWDRIADRGPVFEVSEVDGDRIASYRIQAGGPGRVVIGERRVQDGILLQEASFRVRACTLDHGTPVLAYALEPSLDVNVRKERLEARRLTPGPWLRDLKERIAAGLTDDEILLPDGTRETVGALAADLVLVCPGQKLTYATDFADTPDNRRRATALAAGSHAFFCESAFVQADEAQARRTGHLTTRACGEIASAAGVDYLIPFHFSRRYEHEPRKVYEEIAGFCPQVVIPRLPDDEGA